MARPHLAMIQTLQKELPKAEELPKDKVIQESQALPDYVSSALQQAVERALKLSKEAYTPYTGRRLAHHPQEHQRARTLTQRMVGSFNPYEERVRELTRRAHQSFDNRRHYQAYMQPYEQSVVNELGRLGNSNFNENIMPELESRFISPRGNSRHAGFRDEVNRDMAREFQIHRDDALSRGYEPVMQAFNMDRERELEAAHLMAKLGLSDQGAQASDIDSLQRVAELKREEEQRLLNLQYELWKEEQRHEHERLEELFRFLSGAPKTPSSMQKTTETQAPSSTMHSSDWRSLAEGAAMNIAGGLVSGESVPAPRHPDARSFEEHNFRRQYGFWPGEG